MMLPNADANAITDDDWDQSTLKSYIAKKWIP